MFAANFVDVLNFRTFQEFFQQCIRICFLKVMCTIVNKVLNHFSSDCIIHPYIMRRRPLDKTSKMPSMPSKGQSALLVLVASKVAMGSQESKVSIDSVALVMSFHVISSLLRYS